MKVPMALTAPMMMPITEPVFRPESPGLSVLEEDAEEFGELSDVEVGVEAGEVLKRLLLLSVVGAVKKSVFVISVSHLYC